MTQLRLRFGEIDAWNIEDSGVENLFHAHPDLKAIVHAATDYGRDKSTSLKTFWANEVFPIRLIEVAMQNKALVFINIDTFFNSSKFHYDHLKAYALSKRHFQEWGEYLGSSGKINFVNLRLYHLYGPGDGLEKFVPSIVRRCLTEDVIDLTDGRQKRDFIHVDDAVSAISTVLEMELTRGCGYRHYDVGNGVSISIREFVETVRRICDKGVTLNFGALPTREGEFLDACADAKALRSLGWEGRIGLVFGIRTVVQDVCRRNSIVPIENLQKK